MFIATASLLIAKRQRSEMCDVAPLALGTINVIRCYKHFAPLALETQGNYGNRNAE